MGRAGRRRGKKGGTHAGARRRPPPPLVQPLASLISSLSLFLLSLPSCSFTAAQPLHAVALVGPYLAAGADGRLCLWDGRSARRAGAFDDTHEGDVTGLAVPGAGGDADAAVPGVALPLLSAGVDGLIAVWDLGRGLLEDDAFVVSREGRGGEEAGEQKARPQP